MRSNMVPIVAAVIAIAFAGAAFYYWQGGGESPGPVTGVIIDMYQRQAGTEAGGKPLSQGLNVLTGRSLEKTMFNFVLVRTNAGEEVEIEVPEDLFATFVVGDTIQQASPDARPALVQQAEGY